MPTLGLIVEASTTPTASRSADRALLARAVERGRGTLVVSRSDGDVLALGRWHLAPVGAPEVVLQRRLTGGRAVAAGGGFVQLSLALPHRSALVSDDPHALGPDQILNRAVRGLLGGLEAAGLSAVYPGRDLVTVGGRPIATLGLEIDARGATLVDMVLSVERDQSVLPRLLDRSDPDGDVAAPMILPDDVTAVTRALGRVPGFDEMVTWICQGYARRLGVDFVEDRGPDCTADDDGFVRSRMRRPELDRRARTVTMLGVLEAHCALARDGRLGAVMLAGDFLAPSGTIARLEEALCGCPPVLERVAAVIGAVVRPPDDLILGIGPVRTIAELVVRRWDDGRRARRDRGTGAGRRRRDGGALRSARRTDQGRPARCRGGVGRARTRR
jgi:lipoate-protein ligase A